MEVGFVIVEMIWSMLKLIVLIVIGGGYFIGVFFVIFLNFLFIILFVIMIVYLVRMNGFVIGIV